MKKFWDSGWNALKSDWAVLIFAVAVLVFLMVCAARLFG